jgi:hypothetical protein
MIILIFTPPHASTIFVLTTTTFLEIFVQENVMVEPSVQLVNTNELDLVIVSQIVVEKEVNIESSS